MATPFQTFVNGELPKRPFTQDAAVAWTPGRVVVTTGVALGVTTEVFPAPPVTSVNSSTGAVVITAASISAIPTSQKGAANGVASLDANGFIPMSQMNPGVVERLYVVADETARFALTTAQVQNGDVVKQELPAPAAMYYVQDDTNLDSELGYAIFSAGTAAAVAWSGVTGVPHILLDLKNISGAVTGDILQFDGTNWVKQSRNAYVSALNLQTSDVVGLDTALGNKQDQDLTLDALSDLPDLGFIVQIAEDSFTSRSLEAGDGITITYPDGIDGDPLIALQAGPNTAEGTHGDENTYLGLQIDSHGRTTLVTEYKLQKDTVYIPNSTNPFPLTTKTLYMIGDFLTTTYGDLYLQLPPLTASTVIEIQLAFTVGQVGHVYITPSGTDLIFGQGTPLDLKGLPLAPGCTVKLFFHSVGLGWVGQGNYNAHLMNPKISSFNAASFAAGHRINSQATSGLSIQIPDANIDLGDPIVNIAFGGETGVLTATRVDGTETTVLLTQDHMDKLLNPRGSSAVTPLQVGYTYRPSGSTAIYPPGELVYLPAATVDAFNFPESVPIRLITGNSIISAGYLHLTPQVGETMYHSAINGSVSTSTYLPIPNNSEVTCYMIGVGKWYVDIRQDSNYLDTDHFTLVDPTLRSKSVKFNVAPVGGAGSAQRTITVPDADVSLGKVPTGVTPTYATGRLMVPLADGTSIPLSAFGGTRLANTHTPATVLTANGHYLFYSNTGSYYTVICALVLPTAPDDMTYVRISNISSSSLDSFSVDAGATVAPGGTDKINGLAETLSITDYLVNYRNAVITFTYSAFHENWTVSVLGDLIKPGTVAIYDADKTNTTTLTPVTDLTANRVITLPDANVDLGKVLSNISYAPTTGVITLTNVDASTFATTNIGAIADDMLRIQATGAATKKMGFNCSAVTDGQTRTITAIDANVDLARVTYCYNVSSGTFPSASQLAERVSGAVVNISAVGSFTLNLDTLFDVIGVGATSKTVQVSHGEVNGTPITVTLSSPFYGAGGIMDERASLADTISSVTLRSGDFFTVRNFSGFGYVITRNGRFRSDNFRINDGTTPSKRLAFDVSAIALRTDRTITMPDANVDLSILLNATSSTVASGAFVYATGMGSVVKTITGSGATFNVDALASNRAHSVTIRNNSDNSYPFNTATTFQFVSAKAGGSYDYSGFVDAQGLGLFESTYIYTGAPLTVTLEPNESIEVRYLGSNGGGGELFSMQRNLLGLVTIPSSATSFKLYPERRYALPHGYSGALTLQLPLVDRVGTSITLEDVTGYSTSTITALTIVGGGSQTVFAVASVDIKNFIDNGCTVKLVLQSSNNWVYNVQYSRVIRGNTLGVRNTAGALTSFDVSAATVNRTITLPNTNLDLGNIDKIPAVATPYTTAPMAGTRPQCLGGSGNTFSGGTDVVAIGCSSSDFDGTQVTALGAVGVYAFGSTPFKKQSVILGTSSSPRQAVSDGLSHYAAAFGGITCCWTTERSANGVLQYVLLDGSNTPSTTNCPSLLVSSGALCSATHEVEFIVTTGNADSPLTPKRTYFAKRKVYVERSAAGVATVVLVTLETDQQLGDATSGSITCTVGTDQANNRLLPSITVTAGTTQAAWQASVRITSHHNRK